MWGSIIGGLLSGVGSIASTAVELDAQRKAQIREHKRQIAERRAQQLNELREAIDKPAMEYAELAERPGMVDTYALATEGSSPAIGSADPFDVVAKLKVGSGDAPGVNRFMPVVERASSVQITPRRDPLRSVEQGSSQRPLPSESGQRPLPSYRNDANRLMQRKPFGGRDGY